MELKRLRGASGVDQARSDAAAPALSPLELAQRRQAARRWAWALGLLVLLVYVGGLFVRR